MASSQGRPHQGGNRLMQVCSTLERIGQRVVIDIGVVGDEAATEGRGIV